MRLVFIFHWVFYGCLEQHFRTALSLITVVPLHIVTRRLFFLSLRIPGQGRIHVQCVHRPARDPLTCELSFVAGLRCRTAVSDEVGRSTSVQVSWAFAGLQGRSPYLARPIRLTFFILNQHLLSFTCPSQCCPLACELCTRLACTSSHNGTLNYTSALLIYSLVWAVWRTLVM